MPVDSQSPTSNLQALGDPQAEVDFIRKAAEAIVAAATNARLGHPPAPETETPRALPVSTAPSSSKALQLSARRFSPSLSPSSWVTRIWTPRNIEQARRWGRYVLYGFATWFALVTILIVLYRFVNPPASNLMLYTHLTGQDVHHTWVPLEKISPQLIKAVVVAEDASFCDHWGIDFVAIERAIRNAGRGTPRGASTISMQTAKNLFLWQSKSYIRKLLEVPVTLMMELVWPKRRMLEIYLNIAEWGPGVFGIGAAARHHFRTSAARLGARASAQLAASLPNPKVRRAGKPGPKTRRKSTVIQGRARHGRRFAACVLD